MVASTVAVINSIAVNLQHRRHFETFQPEDPAATPTLHPSCVHAPSTRASGEIRSVTTAMSTVVIAAISINHNQSAAASASASERRDLSALPIINSDHYRTARRPMSSPSADFQRYIYEPTEQREIREK